MAGYCSLRYIEVFQYSKIGKNGYAMQFHFRGPDWCVPILLIASVIEDIANKSP